MTLHNALGVVSFLNKPVLADQLLAAVAQPSGRLLVASRIQNRNKVFPEGNRGDTRAP